MKYRLTPRATRETPRDYLNNLMVMPEPLLSAVVHPAVYLSKVIGARSLIAAAANMPYPADPITEAHLMGLTYFQVALVKRAEAAAAGCQGSLEFFSDRMMGRPAQVNVNVNADSESYLQFLDRIAKAEGDVVDVQSEAAELGL